MKNTSRLLALATLSALSLTALLPAPARADKAKNYKYGAIALGVVGGVLLSKGKTVEGAAVLGAGAYTYKKGEDTRKAQKPDRYGYGYGDRYGYSNGPAVYPGGNGSAPYGTDPRYDNGNYVNGNSNENGNYRARRDRDERYRDDRYRDRDDVRVR